MQENKRAWHTKLKFALWEDKISSKKVIETSPFRLVYGIDVVFIYSLGALVMISLQEEEVETNSIQRRINQLVEVKQIREGAYEKSQILQDRMKMIFDKKVKEEYFQVHD